MQRHTASSGLIACALGLVAAGALAAGLPGTMELVIQPVDAKRPLVVLPIEPGEPFTLHYHHSVNGTPIWEEHTVDDRGKIYIEEERFIAMGAGMGHWPGHGQLTQRGPHQVIENIHEPTGDFVLRVGSAAVGHTLIWRGQCVELSARVPGKAVIVSARVVHPGRRLWRGVTALWTQES